jgi:beta-ribofuranosylaminobenzene 5'-phosphate synthase
MIRVTTGSRLHFGLLNVGAPVPSGRRFGSVGMMVKAPGVHLTVSRAPTWCARGPLAERALVVARRFQESIAPHPVPPQQIIVEKAAPEHAGLGTGTQLALAVARALALAGGLTDLSTEDLSQRVGRGFRSAVGVHGFERGGFLVDAGKGEYDTLAPLVARIRFPEDWPIVLILPVAEQGLHGSPERQAFEQLLTRPLVPAHTDALCRLVLLGLLPALLEHNLAAFGEALHEFNARAGEPFAAVQGGTYASPRVAELVTWLRQQGVAGTGQSSWGPTVFAVAGDEDQANHLAASIRRRFPTGPGQVLVTEAANEGAAVVDNRTGPG